MHKHHLPVIWMGLSHMSSWTSWALMNHTDPWTFSSLTKLQIGAMFLSLLVLLFLFSPGYVEGAPTHTPLTMSLGQPGGCYLHPSWLLFHPQLAPLIYLLILWSCSLQGGLSEGWCFSLPHPGKARTRGLGGYDKCVPAENRCMVSSAEVVYAFSLCKLALPGRERLLGRHNPERQPSLDTPETGFPF